MTTSDDYVDEMRRLNRLTERDIDRLFDGKTPADDETLEDLALHLQGLKATARLQVPEEVASAQITAILSAHGLIEKGESVARPTSKAHGRGGRVSGLPKSTRKVSMRKRLVLLTAKIGAAFVGASMLTVGMAFAGVTLPEAVNDAFGRAGVTLPNQASDALENAGRPEDLPGQVEGEGSDTSAAVQSVIDGWDTPRSCLFGQHVAAAATGGEVDETDNPCLNAQNGTGSAGAQGSKATGDERSGGKSTAGSANAGAEGGPETGATNSGGKSTAGSDNAPTGSGSQGGNDTGSDASSKGQSKRDEAPRSGNEE